MSWLRFVLQIIYSCAEPAHFVVRTGYFDLGSLCEPFHTFCSSPRALGAAIGAVLGAIVASPVAFEAAEL